jgi:trans-aconitate 2-methyltransferase
VQLAWGLEVLDRLELRGDEAVLDAGCGTGRVTERLWERLPRGRVVAVDSSAPMVEKARETLAGRADVLLADLAELRLDEPVDVVFSNAVFHWIADHDRLFTRLHAALRPGGRLFAQCGGVGNVAALTQVVEAVRAEARFAEHLATWRRPWHFRSPTETEEALRRAGFTDIRCWLEPKRIRPDEPDAFLATVPLGPCLESLPAELHGGFVREVRGRMGEPLELDYVRLNIEAVRP